VRNTAATRKRTTFSTYTRARRDSSDETVWEACELGALCSCLPEAEPSLSQDVPVHVRGGPTTVKQRPSADVHRHTRLAGVSGLAAAGETTRLLL
jgi:hypothetical protein